MKSFQVENLNGQGWFNLEFASYLKLYIIIITNLQQKVKKNRKTKKCLKKDRIKILIFVCFTALLNRKFLSSQRFKFLILPPNQSINLLIN